MCSCSFGGDARHVMLRLHGVDDFANDSGLNKFGRDVVLDLLERSQLDYEAVRHCGARALQLNHHPKTTISDKAYTAHIAEKASLNKH